MGEGSDLLETGPPTPDTFWGRLKKQVAEAYKRFQDRLDHGEVVCTKLRKPSRIRVVHSPQADSEDIEKRLRRFLQVSYSKHTRWLVVDGILSLLGGLLMPLPGPNVFFFYPAARTFGHYLARAGARRASQIEWEFRSEPLIQKVEENLEQLENASEEIKSLEASYHLENLSPLLFRLT